MRKSLMMLFVVTMLVGGAFAQASWNSTTPIVATKAESATITAAANLATYDLLNLTPQTLTINSVWNVKPSRTAMGVCVSLSQNLKSADASNTQQIDATMVQSKVGAGAWANINAAAGCGVAGGATLVKTYTLNSQATRVVTTANVDTVDIQINGAALPANLQADTYTGQLTLTAQVTP